jgi:hypothetical protein
LAAGAAKEYFFKGAVRKVWGRVKRLLPPSAAKENYLAAPAAK